MINEVFIPILLLLARVVTSVVIVQFVLSLLMAFNVVSYQNQFVSALWNGLNSILDPILKPIRHRMPDTGMIDLSPIVFLVLIQIAVIVLGYAGRQIG